MEEMVMENFLMNLLGVSAIAGMLYGMFVMWRNIDKELEKMETDSTKEKRSVIGPLSEFSCSSRLVSQVFAAQDFSEMP
jgi:hypothetical protein